MAEEKIKEGKEEEVEVISLQTPKGIKDVLPLEQPFWETLKKAVKKTAEFYNFGRLDTPILEYANLFHKAEGVGTDVAEKEMYILKTKGGDVLVLRPEVTPAALRAYFRHGMSRETQPSKLYYFGAIFRHESPQSGRLREFHQVGFEILGGEDDPIYDAQIANLSLRLLEELKIKDLRMELNSLGCRVCRTGYKKKLQHYYSHKLNKVCEDCKRRFTVNPLRLLDCKNAKCAVFKEEAPSIINSLCVVCRGHFRSVLEYLDELSIPYFINPRLVRGLDYYNRTVFEIFSGEGNTALGGGGRYDYLAENLGFRKGIFPAVGSALGAERIIDCLKEQGIAVRPVEKPKIFFIQIGKEAKKKAIALVEEFRRADIRVSEAFGKESLNAQLKLADKEGVVFALIYGQREVFDKSIIIRDMKDGTQESVPVEKIVTEVKKRIK